MSSVSSMFSGFDQQDRLGIQMMIQADGEELIGANARYAANEEGPLIVPVTRPTKEDFVKLDRVLDACLKSSDAAAGIDMGDGDRHRGHPAAKAEPAVQPNQRSMPAPISTMPGCGRRDVRGGVADDHGQQ